VKKPVARFAPSPTGQLHAGSLLAAVGSYLDARAAGARWLVRMEDLDAARVIPGCADEMLRTLEAYGFEWDGEVLFQSTRRAAYDAALATLAADRRTFHCSCSRKDLAADVESQGYPGTCRQGPTKPGPTARRFRVCDANVAFEDLFLGTRAFDTRALGDFVVERRDGIASYQLAVVVDDAWQGVTRVVRGADLIASTPWQMELQDALGLSRPIYGHLPLVTEPDGRKLSKTLRSIPVPTLRSSGTLRSSHRPELLEVSQALTSTLTHLSQTPPPELARAPIKDVWEWAVANWRPQALAGRMEVRLSASGDNKQKMKP
jgi:glutamyl-Q tRNA(Asp) synthetase